MPNDSTLILLEGIPAFCFGYPFVMAWYWMFGAVLYWLGAERSYPPIGEPPQLERYPPISLIVPCHNEADTAHETFAALGRVQYPEFEVIAVNDGSRDKTGEILEEFAAKLPRMRVVHLPKNQGKATAMNVGAMLARHEILVLIDGDALLDPFALRWVAWSFTRPFVGGLTGNPRIRNRTSILGRLQVGEFSSIVGLIKRAQATYSRLFTVSGVICAFRKRALNDGGWWSPHTMTDDVDVSWRIQLAGWYIAYAPNVVVWILMPETLKGLWQQRLRWAEGGAQMLLDHFGSVVRGKALSLLPVYINAVLSIVWAYCVIATTVLGTLHGFGVPVLPYLPTFTLIPAWYDVLLCVTYMGQATLSTSLERRFEPRMYRSLFWVIWYPLAFWALSALTAAFALPRVLLRSRQARATWVSPDRGLR